MQLFEITRPPLSEGAGSVRGDVCQEGTAADKSSARMPKRISRR